MSVASEALVLPDEMSVRPLEVTLGSVRLRLSFLEESVWDVAEQVGSTRVHHGRLVLQAGRFMVVTASGIQVTALRWQQAIRQHLNIH